MYTLVVLDPNVIKSGNEIPKKSRDNYKIYQKIIIELNRRERDYTSYKKTTKILIERIFYIINSIVAD